MSEERTVVENLGRRRLVREYGADGALRALRLEPIPTSVAPAPPIPTRVAPPEAPPRAPQAASPAPPPVAVPVQALPRENLPVELEAFTAPAPVASPLADAIDHASATLREAPARFQIIAAQPVVDEPPVAVPALAPLRVISPKTRRLVFIDAPVAAPTPPPREELPVELEQYVEAAPVAPTLRAQPAPLPPEPRALAVKIPDLERRVDELLARKPRAAPKRRARVPLEAPRFAPLPRSAWEDRLDAVLRARGH